MKGSLKMWSIFPVFPAVKQKCQVFTWLSWGLSYIYLFQFIIVFILWKGPIDWCNWLLNITTFWHNTNWLVQLITENNYILASCSILWVSLMWALLCLSMSRFRKSVHKSWTLTRGWARSCYFTSEIWERTRGSLMWPWPVRMEPESSIDQAQVWSSTTWIHP